MTVFSRILVLSIVMVFAHAPSPAQGPRPYVQIGTREADQQIQTYIAQIQGLVTQNPPYLTKAQILIQQFATIISLMGDNGQVGIGNLLEWIGIHSQERVEGLDIFKQTNMSSAEALGLSTIARSPITLSEREALVRSILDPANRSVDARLAILRGVQKLAEVGGPRNRMVLRMIVETAFQDPDDSIRAFAQTIPEKNLKDPPLLPSRKKSPAKPNQRRDRSSA